MKDLSKSVFYARCSTQQQADRDSTVNHYRSRALKFGFKPEQIYFDVGSGGSTARQDYQLILDMVSKGLIDAIYLPNDLSRLVRDVQEFKRLQKLFTEANCKLFDLNCNEYKITEPEEILMSDVQMSFYEFQRNLNKHKSIQGHKYLRDNGKAIRAVFPYVKVDGVLIPNTSEYKNTGKSVWEIGKEVIQTYLDCGAVHQTQVKMTEKYGEIINGYKRWEDYCRSTGGMNRWLRSHFIRGNIHYKTADLVAYGTHEPLIDEDTANQIDKLLEIGGQGRSYHPKIHNIWKGIARCHCGARMRVHLIQKFSRKRGKTNYRYLVCSEAYTNNENKLRKRRAGVEVAKCKDSATFGLTIEKMEDLTIEALMRKAEDIANQQFSKPTIFLPEEVTVLERQIEQYKKLALEDKDLLPVLNKKQLQLNKLLEGYKTNDEVHLDYLRNSLTEFGRSKEFWQRATREEKLLLFNEFVEAAICTEGQVEFFFKV